MVRRLLAFIDREIRGLHEAAYVLAGFALLSQVLALVRDRAFAYYFGAGPELDMYFAAFRVPDTAFAFLTLFVSSFALIPLFSSHTKEARAGVLRSLLLIFGVVAIPATVLIAVFLSTLVPYFVPGFSPEGLITTTNLARIMLLQPFILGISSIISAYVQSERRFVLFALAPIFYNAGIIIGALFLYPVVGIMGLAWGVVLGAVLHLLVQFFPLSVHGKGGQGLSLKDTYRLVVKPSVPRALALMANQILLIVFAAIASVIAVGAVSSMTFAFNLQSVPLTVIGLSYASALFPSLATMAHRHEWSTYAKEVWATMRHILFWLLPATMFLIVLRAHIVRVVLGSGAFSWDDTRLTAAILAFFAVSLIGQAAILAFSRAYYAAGKTMLPIALNVGGAFVAGVLAYYSVSIASAAPFIMHFFEALLRVSDVPGTLVLMIPASYSAAMLLTALIFGVLFAVRFGFDWSFLSSVGVSFFSSVIGAGVTYLALQLFEPLLLTNTFLGIFAQGALAGVLGLSVWALVLFLMGSSELRDVLTLIHNNILRISMDTVTRTNARTYDARARDWKSAKPMSISHSYLEKPAMTSLLSGLEGKSILCIGVGSGEELAGIMAQGPSRVVAIDIAPQLLKVVRDEYPSVETKVMDMMHLRFSPDEFDFVYSGLAFHYAKDWDVLLARVFSVLKPGGGLLFSTNHPDYWGQKHATGRTHINPRGVALTEHTHTFPGGVPLTYYNHSSVSSIEESLVHAGFSAPECYSPEVIDADTARMTDEEREVYTRLKEKNDTSPLFVICYAIKQ